jgi:hypothetical protein
MDDVNLQKPDDFNSISPSSTGKKNIGVENTKMSEVPPRSLASENSELALLHRIRGQKTVVQEVRT